MYIIVSLITFPCFSGSWAQGIPAASCSNFTGIPSPAIVTATARTPRCFSRTPSRETGGTGWPGGRLWKSHANFSVPWPLLNPGHHYSPWFSMMFCWNREEAMEKWPHSGYIDHPKTERWPSNALRILQWLCAHPQRPWWTNDSTICPRLFPCVSLEWLLSLWRLHSGNCMKLS